MRRFGRPRRRLRAWKTARFRKPARSQVRRSIKRRSSVSWVSRSVDIVPGLGLGRPDTAEITKACFKTLDVEPHPATAGKGKQDFTGRRISGRKGHRQKLEHAIPGLEIEAFGMGGRHEI